MQDDILARALAYPYELPGHSYHFSTALNTARPILPVAAHSARPLGGDRLFVPTVDLEVRFADGGGGAVYERRVALIASGSNASFTRLKGKFLDAGIETHFPVLQATARGLVPVYSAHLSRYGAIPGTLAGEPAARSLLYVAFLDWRQLCCVNASEMVGVNYGLGMIDSAEIDLGEGQQVDAVLAYVSMRGALAPGGTPCRIASFKAEGSALPALDQKQILEIARARFAPDDSLSQFVQAHVRDDALRQSRIEAFADVAAPIGIEGLSWVMGGPAAGAHLPDGFMVGS